MTRCLRTMCILPWLFLTAPSWTAESVALPVDQLDVLMRQCARAVPQGIKGAWPLTASDAAAVDTEVRHLPSISVGNATIRTPFTSARQYLGVIIDGESLVYVNGYPPNAPRAVGGATVTCGRGSGYWGALYDPRARQFSQFEVNAE
jgi:hypothetical protein